MRRAAGQDHPTLEVVATRAGVSRATASRALRGSTRVSEATRQAVLRAANDVSYTPNLAARALVTRRSGSVAFLVAETEDRFFGDPYFLGMLRGAHAEVAAAGLQMVFVVASTPADSAKFVRYAAGGHVDGVLLMSLHGDDALPYQLEALNVPTVVSGRPMSGNFPIHYVDSDNFAGARAATELLIASGRTRVATITGPLDMAAGLDRLTGYREAMLAAGLAVGESLIAEGDFSTARGAKAMSDLLDAEPGLDAVFASSDLTALGAMRVLDERGRVIPDDVAVVGFDDICDAAFTSPPLTTVRQDIDRLARTLARTLLTRIAGGAVDRKTIVPVKLVTRNSA